MRALHTSGLTGLLIVAQLVVAAFLLGVIWVRLDWPLPLAYLLVLVPTAAVASVGLVVAFRLLTRLSRRLLTAWQERWKRRR